MAIATDKQGTLRLTLLASGGGLLNGETQKAIMGSVPHDRAGMASGISTTSRFSGILLGFAVLSGVLATVTRNWLTDASCGGSSIGCNDVRRFADAVVTGDLPQAVVGMTAGARELALEQARLVDVARQPDAWSSRSISSQPWLASALPRPRRRGDLRSSASSRRVACFPSEPS